MKRRAGRPARPAGARVRADLTRFRVLSEAGARNAALLAAAILANADPALRERLRTFRAQQTRTVLETTL